MKSQTLDAHVLLFRGHRREKTSECPFNLNSALWGFSLWNASFVCQRLFPVETQTGQNRVCVILVATDLTGQCVLFNLRTDYISLRMQLIQANPSLLGAVRSGDCSDGLKRDQVDNSRCFPLWTFQSSLSLAKPAKS